MQVSGQSDILETALGDLWRSKRIISDVAALCDDYGHRFAGSESEIPGRDFILRKFREYGLSDVHLESCTYVGWRRGTCDLQLLEPRNRTLEAVSLVLSPPTADEGIDVGVVYAGVGTKEDFDVLGSTIKGQIVLVRAASPLGTFIHRVSKYGWACERGAVGVIFIKEEANQLIGTGTIAAGYREAGKIPAVEVSFETGAYLLRQMDRSPLRIRLRLRAEVVPDAETWNIVGDIPGNPNAGEQIIVGAHWDGHDRADAAMDNALGVFTMLDTARALRRLKGHLRRNVRFVGFGNEESWIVGSSNYVAQHYDEMDKVALMINADAIARFGRTHIRVGRPELYVYFEGLLDRAGIPTTVSYSGWLPGSSDEWPFLSDGVPSISMRGTQTPEERSRGRGLDHTQADTVDKIDDLRARESAMMLAQVLVAVADAEQRPGAKLARSDMFRRFEEDGAQEELRAQGRWHPETVL